VPAAALRTGTGSEACAAKPSDDVRHAATPEAPRPCAGYGSKRRWRIDFTQAPIEEPLSADGAWSNNTQGVGGNGAPNNLNSMRVALASDSVTRIAMRTATPQLDDDDAFAFAFKPGGGTNMRIPGVIHRAPGYAPSANQEIELILGCKTPAAAPTAGWSAC
jgi:hypothetical protein